MKQEVCSNCKKIIELDQQAYVYKNNIVCEPCYKQLISAASCTISESGGPSPKIKPKFFSISGDPKVPLAVRVYGEIIEALNFIGMVGGAIGTLLGMLVREGILVLMGPVQFVICLLFYLLGKELTLGKRKAVYGICILGGLLLICGIYSCAIAIDGFVRGLVLLSVVFVSVLYIPPIIIAFWRWECFH